MDTDIEKMKRSTETTTNVHIFSFVKTSPKIFFKWNLWREEKHSMYSSATIKTIILHTDSIFLEAKTSRVILHETI